MCGICHTVRVHRFRMALWYNDTIQTCARSCTYPKSQQADILLKLALEVHRITSCSFSFALF